MTLVDRFGREHTYMRISLTEQCNMRCVYCMPADRMQNCQNNRVMSANDVVGIASYFVSNGVNKIRLTGGEPLARKDIADIMGGLSALNVELTMTTNGMLVHRVLSHIVDAGIHSINISLDSLSRATFKTITARDVFHRVMSNIHMLLERGIRVKLNVVLLKGINDSEINAFVGLTEHLPVHVRFIEYMPFTGNGWDRSVVVTHDDVIRTVSERFAITKLADSPTDTSKKYCVEKSAGSFAVITTMSRPFCDGCNRLRLTADGYLKNCLFSNDEYDLLTAYLSGQGLDDVVQAALSGKHKVQGGQFSRVALDVDPTAIRNRSMISIGG